MKKYNEEKEVQDMVNSIMKDDANKASECLENVIAEKAKTRIKSVMANGIE